MNREGMAAHYADELSPYARHSGNEGTLLKLYVPDLLCVRGSYLPTQSLQMSNFAFQPHHRYLKQRGFRGIQRVGKVAERPSDSPPRTFGAGKGIVLSHATLPRLSSPLGLHCEPRQCLTENFGQLLSIAAFKFSLGALP